MCVYSANGCLSFLMSRVCGKSCYIINIFILKLFLKFRLWPQTPHSGKDLCELRRPFLIEVLLLLGME